MSDEHRFDVTAEIEAPNTPVNRRPIRWTEDVEIGISRFDGQVIMGPAILIVAPRITMKGCDSTASGEHGHDLAAFTFSDARPPRYVPSVQGVLPHVISVDAVFENCRFENIWLWAPRSAFPKTRLMQWVWFKRHRIRFENCGRPLVKRS